MEGFYVDRDVGRKRTRENKVTMPIQIHHIVKEKRHYLYTGNLIKK